MTRKKAPEHWEYESLRWIHEARAKIYEREKGIPLTELKPSLSPAAAAMVRRLGLKRMSPSELRQAASAEPARRKRKS